MDKKAFKLEIKNIDEQGTFTGMASIFGNKDLGDDIVVKGAFKRTLQHKNNSIVLLWNHNPDFPIGMGDVKETDKGLEIKGQLNLETTKGKETYVLLKQGALKGLSFGYDVVKFDFDAKGSRLLQEVKLWEVSVVTFPMNPKAGVNNVKSEKQKENDKELDLKTLISQIGKDSRKAIDFNSAIGLQQMKEMRWQMNDALWESINSILDDASLDSNQKMVNATNTIDQYKNAFMSWFNMAVTNNIKGINFDIETKMNNIESLLKSKTDSDDSSESNSSEESNDSGLELKSMFDDMKKYLNEDEDDNSEDE